MENNKKAQTINELPADLINNVPQGLPVPIDDGACQHLANAHLPPVKLMSTSGSLIDLSSIPGWLVIYCYPMTGRPGVPIPSGWVKIPGAAGCTPQSCSFRDNYSQLITLNARVFGMSTQSTVDQSEAKHRLRIPYNLLSDASLEFATALNLPVFEVNGMYLLKRVTLIANSGKIMKYFYPVFPPDKNVNEVLTWLHKQMIKIDTSLHQLPANA